jgi:hypothetical protein
MQGLDPAACNAPFHDSTSWHSESALAMPPVSDTVDWVHCLLSKLQLRVGDSKAFAQAVTVAVLGEDVDCTKESESAKVRVFLLMPAL